MMNEAGRVREQKPTMMNDPCYGCANGTKEYRTEQMNRYALSKIPTPPHVCSDIFPLNLHYLFMQLV